MGFEIRGNSNNIYYAIKYLKAHISIFEKILKTSEFFFLRDFDTMRLNVSR